MWQTVSFQRHSCLGPYKLPNSSASHKIFEQTRNLFILMDPVIIFIHFRSNQLPFSLSTSTAAFQIKKKLVNTPAYLLKLRSSFMPLSFRSQNSGYTLFQLFHDLISHERRNLCFMFKILKMIYCYIQYGMTYLEGNSGLLWSVLKPNTSMKSNQICVL